MATLRNPQAHSLDVQLSRSKSDIDQQRSVARQFRLLQARKCTIASQLGFQDEAIAAAKHLSG